ncbi:PREDICTED: piggyBac transposable element-derived protein 4-like [Vollenhovia emeryi]|uniref:piggyBac transposable element-derived protein 4-like n=1 Tax=Vollenhovia emeryi TaxID=411798 RepID=UPI0005F418EA|nr:PREDICTED: piggyBac transposable element-derived protein 4-like [Vollenhovia emeryi]XP_011864173.1 PREDICTED: piggyBac transposable element-derived protein 4-like [Vollenhovia emeryi]
MTDRSPKDIRRLLRERPPEINYEELSEDEVDYVEEFSEVDDIQDCDEDTSLDHTYQNDLEYESDEQQEAQTSGRPQSVIKGKNNYKWYKTAPETRGRRSTEVYLPKGSGDARNVKTPLEAWSLLFPTELLEIVILQTNAEIRRRDNYPTEGYTETNLVELKALLGLLYYSGMEKQNHTNTEDLWKPRFGSNLYRAVMARNRFHYLLECLRFDDKATRVERRKVHGLAPIKEIWDMFISNCTRYYSPSTYCTIDEQLLNFRGRFGSKVYIPSKPDKYGIKIVSMHDVQTSYMINAEPYVGRVLSRAGESVPSYYVRRLSESIYNTGRNITCDNWFMSVDLVRKMKTDYGLTMIGTVRKNKREIPPSFTRTAAAGTTRYAYAEGNTLVSYCPKKNKVVILLSSLHNSGRLDKETEKPEIVAFYNRTKGGTDTFDQMCHLYTTARVTARWPLRLFFDMMDHAAVNSFILYSLRSSNEGLNRRDFLKDLTFSLVEPQLRFRLTARTLRANLRVMINEILQINPELSAQIQTVTAQTHKLQKRKRCSFCITEKKTVYCCALCKKPTCDDHRVNICKTCHACS